MPLYVNKPGGVIVHLKDGTATNLAYGDKVDEDALADHVDVKEFADGKQRKPDPEELEVLEAHRRAALAEGGQVNSSSSPVPGNYSDLDEDDAAQLVESLKNYPAQQAEVIKHEILFGGNRQKVLDAAGDYANKVAELGSDAAEPERTELVDVSDVKPAVPLPDPLTATGREGLSDEDEKARIKALSGSTPPPASGDNS